MKKIKTGKLLSILLLLAPSLIGISVFLFIPGGMTLRYAFTDIMGSFIWFAKFADIFSSSAFILAVRNSLRFIVVSVPLNMIIAFLLAYLMQSLRHKKVLSIAFMLPLIVPSSSVVFFWNALFADNGAINSFLFQNNINTVPWFQSNWAFVIIVLVFLFRNIGFNLVLFMSGLQFIPSNYYDVAKVEGAGAFSTFRHVTFIYLLPTIFLVFMMSVINSFRIFREIYLLYGQWPHPSVYMLQHFMNSQFVFANLQRLSATATVLSGAVFVLVIGVFTAQKRVSDTFS